MRFSDRAIVLQQIRHGDKRHILKLYTKAHGLVTAIAIIGKSAGSRVKSSTILPLSIIDVELIVKQNKEIQQLTESSSAVVTAGIHQSLSKLSIAQFLNEILLKALKEQQPNTPLFDFIENSLVYLDEAERDYINLHLYFLLELSKHLGFEPQNNFNKQEPYFDCREGRFTELSLAFPLGLNAEESRLFAEFMNVNILTSPISKNQRILLLEILLAYYRVHLPTFNEVLSLEVLKEVLAG
jgi:DNA repair protein RecO (recombination protein O)